MRVVSEVAESLKNLIRTFSENITTGLRNIIVTHPERKFRTSCQKISTKIFPSTK